MATNPPNEVIRHLRRTLLREGDDLTDCQLLECFVTRRESAALEALVRRHAPMVWGVCRRVLHNYHDAEDAFQATFLILVRKAASIGSPELLANWLYGVAHQTARKARQTAARRRTRERQVRDMPEPETAPQNQDHRHDMQPLLDQELSRLPDKYRVALVLCDLQGHSRKEAARQLGLPEGTVASRLGRARTMLAKRLARRGWAVSGGTLAALLAEKVAPAAVPTSVMLGTINAATLLAAGQAAVAGSISAPVAALTDGMVKAMFLMKLRTATAALAIIGLVVFGGLVAYPRVAGQQVGIEKLRLDDKKGAASRDVVAAVQPEKQPPKDKKGRADTPKKDGVKADKAAPPKEVASGPFRVSVELDREQVKPERARIRVSQPFKVSVSVVNSSQSRQSFRVANGSWEMHWTCSNERIHWVPRAVFRNFIETVTLEPGKAYQQTGSMILVPGKPQKEVAFKLGFTPEGSKETYWSKEVILQIEAD